MFKVGLFQGSEEYGPAAVPLFGPSDSYFEKVASVQLLPEVASFIATLKPQNDCQYVLVNAMGAGEYYSSNVNGDRFSESALIHRPDKWTGIPAVDKLASATWAYGFPTFYRAHVYAHHRNKDASRALGFVELAAWNPHMHRVELVTRLEKDRCLKFGGEGVWDKLKAHEFPDVSMGTKVPFDTCFPAGTLVRTARGQVAIELVVAGDSVLTHTGKYSPVTGVMRTDEAALLRLVAAGLPAIESTEEHPYFVVREAQVRACRGTNNGRRERHALLNGLCPRCETAISVQPDWVAASALRVGDYLAVPAVLPAGRVEVQPARARLLGYYLGDGYVVRQRTGKKKDGAYRDMGVGFSVGTSEVAHLDRLMWTLSDVSSNNGPHAYDAGAGRAAHIVTLYDQTLAAWVQERGGATCEGKRLSKEVFSWQEEAKLELVAGYLDTDGSFDAKTGQVRIASVNRGLLLDVQQLLLAMGIHCSVCFAGSSSGYASLGRESSALWYLVLPGSQAQRFVGRSTKVVQKDFQCSSSQMLFCEGYWLTPIKSIEALDEVATVYNIEVAGDESYVAEGRAVHNCSITLDRKLYRHAWETYDPKKDKSPGDAILRFHKELKAKNGVGIRGLSITRNDYSEICRTQMNRILPDGRKVWVDNDFPAFFDISYVFIGADKIAKAMLKIADDGRVYSMGSAEYAEKLGAVEPALEKTASAESSAKQAEMTKKVVPNQLAGKAVPALAAREADLPKDALDACGEAGLSQALATLSGLGFVLRPREFQRVVLVSQGKGSEADKLEDAGQLFSKTDDVEDMPLSGQDFSTSLAQRLLPLMSERSGLGPFIERRVIIVLGSPEKKASARSSHSSPLLRKIGAAYNGYRTSLMQFVPHAQDLIESASMPGDVELRKIAAASSTEVFTPLSYHYFKLAFLDEWLAGDIEPAVVNLSSDKAQASVQRVSPW